MPFAEANELTSLGGSCHSPTLIEIQFEFRSTSTPAKLLSFVNCSGEASLDEETGDGEEVIVLR